MAIDLEKLKKDYNKLKSKKTPKKSSQKKILSKPKAKIKKISSKQIVKQFMNQANTLVRDQDKPESYFNKEYAQEKNKWLN